MKNTLKKVGTLGHLTLPLTPSLVLAVAGIVLCLLFFAFPHQRTELTFVAVLLGGLAVIHTAYYSALTLQENLYRDKIAHSFEIADKLSTIEMIDIRVFVADNLTGSNITPRQAYAKIMEKTEIHLSVRRLLGLFEDASIAIQKDYADEETLEKSLGYIVPWAYESFKPYITQQRELTKEKNLYIEFGKLAVAWSSGQFLTTGKQIPNN